MREKFDCQESQSELISNFIETNLGKEKKSYQEKLKACRTQIGSGKSSFDWVDSVLVQAIVSGEWVVFENANLCNPSILDRLNGLLERGTFSGALPSSFDVPEKGLVDTSSNIPVHPNFKCLFLMTKKSYVDEGREVSRALKNRCLFLSVDFSEQLEQNPLLNQQVASVRERLENDRQIVFNASHTLLKS